MRVLVKRLCIENGLKYSHFAPMAGIKTRSFGNWMSRQNNLSRTNMYYLKKGIREKYHISIPEEIDFYEE